MATTRKKRQKKSSIRTPSIDDYFRPCSHAGCSYAAIKGDYWCIWHASDETLFKIQKEFEQQSMSKMPTSGLMTYGAIMVEVTRRALEKTQKQVDFLATRIMGEKRYKQALRSLRLL